MENLINKLAIPSARSAIITLLSDTSTRCLIQQQLAKMAEDSTAILPQSTANLVLCKLTTFGASETDTVRIYQAFMAYFTQKDCRCGMLNQKSNQIEPPAKIANKITVCLGFFRAQAERQYNYHAAPSPQYYQKLAQNCYNQTGFQTIAEELGNWLNFIHESFSLTTIKQ